MFYIGWFYRFIRIGVLGVDVFRVSSVGSFKLEECFYLRFMFISVLNKVFLGSYLRSSKERRLRERF